jgi:hypothetical protein
MGPGVFYNNYPAVVTKDFCEIKLQKDFLEYTGRVDWIITNPPWSLFRKFLQKGLEVSSNSVWLITVNHLWTKARLRDIKEAGQAIKEIVLMPTPPSFPSSGFQLGAIHIGPAKKIFSIEAFDGRSGGQYDDVEVAKERAKILNIQAGGNALWSKDNWTVKENIIPCDIKITEW